MIQVLPLMVGPDPSDDALSYVMAPGPALFLVLPGSVVFGIGLLRWRAINIRNPRRRTPCSRDPREVGVASLDGGQELLGATISRSSRR